MTVQNLRSVKQTSRLSDRLLVNHAAIKSVDLGFTQDQVLQ